MSQTKHPNAAFDHYLITIRTPGRTMLLPTLLEPQRLFGQIPKTHAEIIGSTLKVSLAEIIPE